MGLQWILPRVEGLTRMKDSAVKKHGLWQLEIDTITERQLKVRGYFSATAEENPQDILPLAQYLNQIPFEYQTQDEAPRIGKHMRSEPITSRIEKTRDSKWKAGNEPQPQGFSAQKKKYCLSDWQSRTSYQRKNCLLPLTSK